MHHTRYQGTAGKNGTKRITQGARQVNGEKCARNSVAAVPLRAELRLYAEAQVMAFKKLYRSTRRRPAPAAVHHLRVATRRLGALLWLLKPKGRQSHRLRHQFASLTEHLGRIRELDVACMEAKKYGLEHSKLSACRQAERTKLARYLKQRPRKCFGCGLQSLCRDADSANPQFIMERLSELEQRLQSTKAIFLHSPRDTHHFRIKAKRMRYVLEAFGSNPEPLAKLQDSLGKVHDLQILMKLQSRSSELKSHCTIELKQASRLANLAMRFVHLQILQLQDLNLN
jgi:CHAD domain-containing protein